MEKLRSFGEEFTGNDTVITPNAITLTISAEHIHLILCISMVHDKDRDTREVWRTAAQFGQMAVLPQAASEKIAACPRMHAD